MSSTEKISLHQNKNTSEFDSIARITSPFEVTVIIVSIAAIFVNLGVLLVIFIGPRSFRTPTFYFISSLASADMLTGMSVILAILLPVGDSPQSRLYLKGTAVVSFSASVNNLMAIATDRYIKIKDEDLYRKLFTKKSSIVIIAFVWVMAFFVFLIVPAISWSCGDGRCHCYNNGLCHCDPVTCSQSFTPFTKSYILTGVLYFYISFTVMIAIYVTVFLFVRSQPRKLSTNRTSLNVPAVDKENLRISQIYEINEKFQQMKFSEIYKRREIRLAKTLFMVMGVFFFCWIPVTTLFIYDYLHGDPNLIHAFDYCLAPAVIHPFLNPIIYSMRLPRMWKSFKMLAYAFWRRAFIQPSEVLRENTLVRQSSTVLKRPSFRNSVRRERNSTR